MANYQVGRGKVYFSKFKTGTYVPEGFRYIGNTPELSISMESEDLDHFSSDAGTRELDNSVALQTNRSGSLVTDEISPENLAYVFLGSSSALVQTSGSVTGEALADVIKGMTYQLGISDTLPAGIRNISTVVVKKAAATLVLGTDYTLDLLQGTITILKASVTLSDGDDLTVDYAKVASTRSIVVSGSKVVEGAIKYVEDNAAGENSDYYLPYVKLMPNGDFNLKSDEWLQIPLSLKILKAPGREAIYRNGASFA